MNIKKYIAATIVGSFILSTSSVFADVSEMRTWTQEKSGAKLKGKVIDKMSSGKSVRIEFENGKKHWVKIDTLIQSDQEYASMWCPPEKHITARIVGKKKGSKTLEITAIAGLNPMKVVAKPTPSGGSVTKMLKKGETLTFEVTLSNKYEVKAYKGVKKGKETVFTEVIDTETHTKKSGLR
ncbi:MAG: hypothetical protein ACPG32_15830 [Akkermansiaceae bacterium]